MTIPVPRTNPRRLLTPTLGAPPHRPVLTAPVRPVHAVADLAAAFAATLGVWSCQARMEKYRAEKKAAAGKKRLETVGFLTIEPFLIVAALVFQGCGDPSSAYGVIGLQLAAILAGLIVTLGLGCWMANFLKAVVPLNLPSGIEK